MPDLKQGIQDFFRVAQERDFTRNHHFRVIDITDRGASVVTQDDLVYCEAATLPSRAVSNIPVPYMGLNFNVPGTATYPGSEGYTLTFRADGDHIIRTIFEDWSLNTFDDQSSSGEYRLFRNSQITLGMLNQAGEVTRQYQLVGVWPVTVGELSFDMKGNGDPISFTATLAYQYWTRNLF
jgi:hypothetical protein